MPNRFRDRVRGLGRHGLLVVDALQAGEGGEVSVWMVVPATIGCTIGLAIAVVLIEWQNSNHAEGEK